MLKTEHEKVEMREPKCQAEISIWYRVDQNMRKGYWINKMTELQQEALQRNLFLEFL